MKSILKKLFKIPDANSKIICTICGNVIHDGDMNSFINCKTNNGICGYCSVQPTDWRK